MSDLQRHSLSLFAGAAVLLAAAGLEAAIIVVPDDLPTIQAAVTAALPGDTVQVRPGTYPESVRVEAGQTGLVLEGLGGRPVIAPPSGADAIRVNQVDGVVIRGLDIAASGGRGVRFDTSVGSTVDDLIVTGAKDGVLMRKGSGNTVSDSSVSGAFTDGIRFERSPGGVASDNTVASNGRNGIWMKSCDTAAVTGNTISASGKDGIQVTRADASASVTGNGIVTSGRVGLHVKSSANLTVTSNSSVGATKEAIALQRVTGGTFDGNTGNGATASGIRLRKAPGVTVSNSVADGNGQYGFWVQASPPIDDIGDLTGAGNTATGNPSGDFRVDP